MHKSTEATFLINYVLECSKNETYQKRAEIYRNLAEIAPSEESTKQLLSMAQDLEKIESQTRSLHLEITAS